MKVELYRRHYGVHTFLREAEIPGEFGDYATPKPDDTRTGESKLIDALPDGFLPDSPRRTCLLAVSDENGGTGQSGLTLFRDWGKYFDAYCLDLVKAEPPAVEPDNRPDTVALGAEACRAVMRAMDDEPIRMERYNPAEPMKPIVETTSTFERAGRRVVVLPTLDFVSVRAVLRTWGDGLDDLAVLRPGEGQFEPYIFVRYPPDPTLITEPDYGRELRDAIDKALEALNAEPVEGK